MAADDGAAVGAFVRAGFDELVTHADFRRGRDATVLRKRRHDFVANAAPAPAPAPAAPDRPPPPPPPPDVGDGSEG